MLKTYITFIFLFACTFFLEAQSPKQFNFQGVARDIEGQVYANTNLSIRVSLIRNGTSGIVDYSERHIVSTSGYGVFDIHIGGGDEMTGSMEEVEWGDFPYYLKLELDPSGGTDYLYMGTSQLLSVPYALYAGEAGSGNSTPQVLTYNSDTHELSISEGNTIELPTGEQGAQGEQGNPGVQGEQGLQGNDGVQGEQGTAGTGISLLGNVATVGDLPADASQGDLYIVQDTGDGYAWDGSMWNNVGPIQGPQGEMGIQGLVGAPGEQGEQGNPGIQGEQGLQGDVGGQGETGEQGIQGEQGTAGTGISLLGNVATVGDLPADASQGDLYIVQDTGDGYAWDGSMWNNVGPIQGPQGEMGIQGLVGAPGEQGEQGNPGIQGEQGLQGDVGGQGETGEQGIQGEQGTAGTGISLLGNVATVDDLPADASQGDLYIVQDTGDGYTWDGSMWNNVGPIQGPQGNVGPIGPQGEQGEQGLIGNVGLQGEVGEQGLQGIQGLQGLTGEQGVPGAMGEQGVPGPAGTYTSGSGINIIGNEISAIDNSVSNEIQILNLVGSDLTLNNGGGSVDLGNLPVELELPYFGVGDEINPLFIIYNDNDNGQSIAIEGMIGTGEAPEVYSAGVVGVSLTAGGVLLDSPEEESSSARFLGGGGLGTGHGVFGLTKSYGYSGVYGVVTTGGAGVSGYAESSLGLGGAFGNVVNTGTALSTYGGRVGFGTQSPIDKVEIIDTDKTRLGLNGRLSGGRSSLAFMHSPSNTNYYGWLWDAELQNQSNTFLSLKDYSFNISSPDAEVTNTLYSLERNLVLDQYFYKHKWHGSAYFDNFMSIDGRGQGYTILRMMPGEVAGYPVGMEFLSYYDEAIGETVMTLFHRRTNNGFPFLEPTLMYRATHSAGIQQHRFSGRLEVDGKDTAFGRGASINLMYDAPEGATHYMTLSTDIGADDVPTFRLDEVNIGAAGPGEFNPLYEIISNPALSLSGLGGVYKYNGQVLTNGLAVVDGAFSNTVLQGNASKVYVNVAENSFYAGLHVDTDATSSPSAIFHNNKGAAIETLGAVDIVSHSNTGHPLRVVQKNGNGAGFGFKLINGADEAKNWELLTHNNGSLTLYFNGAYRGKFHEVSGNYESTSDARLKTNISDLVGVLPRLLALDAKKYEYKSHRGTSFDGFLAQEVQAVFPEVVREVASAVEGENSTFLVDYSQLTVLAIAAIKEQQQVISAQKSEIDALKQQHRLDLEAIYSRLEALEK